MLGFPGSSVGKGSARNAGDPGSIPELGRSPGEGKGYISELGRFPGEGKGYPLQYSDLGNSMDCIVYGVAKSWT